MKRSHKLTALTLAVLMLLTVFTGCAANKGGDAAPGDKNDAYNDAQDYEEVMLENGNFNELSQDVLPDGSKPSIDESVFIENPFISTNESNVSTFSADVDTASYSYFRKLVNAGYKLEQLQNNAKSFRTEEFINYFRYTVSSPSEGELFGTHTEITACPWNEGTLLLRLTLQAEEAVKSEGNNLVFLIDVSGSMSSNDKLPLLKESFSYLVGNLGANDKVSIVTYSGREAVVLDGCSGLESDRITNAIKLLKASGSTNGEAGLTEAYRIAEKNYIEGGNNRIIMASDGDLNVGISSESDLKSYIEEKRKQGVYLSVMGFGSGNYRDAKMETLADNGNGVYYYIDGLSEAEKVLGTDLLGTLYTVAEDVKLQLTFDKKYISAYRLIGYENRILNQEDFEDDTKDAGEVGAGHQVTVCYEIQLTEDARNASEDWMKLAVRYKNPGEELSLLNEYGIGTEQLSETTGNDAQFLTCVIRLCMILHNSQYLGDTNIITLLEELNEMELSAYPEREEFRELVQKLAQ